MKPRLTTSQRLDRMVTERELQRYVEEALDLYGWVWHHAGDSRRSTPGLPDIVAVRRNRMIFAELKTQLGRTSAVQKVWLQALVGCPGVETYVWRPSDMAEINERLR